MAPLYLHASSPCHSFHLEYMMFSLNTRHLDSNFYFLILDFYITMEKQILLRLIIAYIDLGWGETPVQCCHLLVSYFNAWRSVGLIFLVTHCSSNIDLWRVFIEAFRCVLWNWWIECELIYTQLFHIISSLVIYCSIATMQQICIFPKN